MVSPRGDIRYEVLIGFGVLDPSALGVPLKAGNHLGRGRSHEITV